MASKGKPKHDLEPRPAATAVVKEAVAGGPPAAAVSSSGATGSAPPAEGDQAAAPPTSEPPPAPLLPTHLEPSSGPLLPEHTPEEAVGVLNGLVAQGAIDQDEFNKLYLRKLEPLGATHDAADRHWARPIATSIPSARSASVDSNADTRSAAARTPAMTFAKSTSRPVALMPSSAPERRPCATLAAWRSALLGTQPSQVQSPPMRSASTSSTRAPSLRAVRAAVRPAAPAPMTIRSCVARPTPPILGDRRWDQGRNWQG
jgi:hypothetical protein